MNINSLNPAISIIAGDFNGKHSKRYFDTSDNIGKELHIIASTARYTQISDKPIHLIKCLCNRCHGDIIYGKINCRVFLPPSYFRTTLNWKNADVDSVQRTIEKCNSKYEFESKTINEKIIFSPKNY